MKTKESFDKREFLTVMLLLIAISCIIAMFVYTGLRRLHYKQGETYTAIVEKAVTIQPTAVDVEEEMLSDIEVMAQVDPRAEWMNDRDGQDAYYMYIDFDALKEQNSDCIGWIYACGGAINLPIVESSDSQYYLHHDFNKKQSPYGCVYTESLDDKFIYSDTAIYGHHMKNNTMFWKFVDYKNEDFYKEYPAVYIFTEDGDRRYEIFSAYYLPVKEIEALEKETEGMNKAQVIEHLKSRSLYDMNVEVSEDDVILTIVTCEYSTGNSRMILHAKTSNNK